MRRFWFVILVLAAVWAGIEGWRWFTMEPTQQRYEKQFRPIAEFEPTKAVLISEYLLTDALHGVEFSTLITQAEADVIILTEVETTPEDMPWYSELLAKLPKNRYKFLPISHESLWLRDFGPIPILQKYGTQDTDLAFADFRFRDNGRLDDTMPYQVALHFEKSVLHLPFAFEGGNFMTDGHYCLMTDEFTESTDAKDTKVNRMSKSRAAALMREELGCKKTLVIENAPHEHIDMWLKFTAKNRALINKLDIPDDIIAEGGEALDNARYLAANLDSIARQLAGTGIEVKRIPQPYLSTSEDDFFSDTNSALINGTVIVPSYLDLYKDDPVKTKFITAIEQQVLATYQEEGYVTKSLQAGGLIQNGGAIHCVTNHIPWVLERNAPRISLMQ